jgi:hypothetical protein
LIYFTAKTRIDAFDIEMEASDWSKLSESAGARTNAMLAAAERIGGDSYPFYYRPSSVSIVLRMKSTILILLVLSASVTIIITLNAQIYFLV